LFTFKYDYITESKIKTAYTYHPCLGNLSETLDSAVGNTQQLNAVQRVVLSENLKLFDQVCENSPELAGDGAEG